MKRIKMVLAVASVAVLLVAFAAPAMAQGNMNNGSNDRHLDQRDVQLDQRLLNNDDDSDFVSFEDPFFFGVPSFFVLDDFCPFAGDTEGIVNEFDCFS